VRTPRRPSDADISGFLRRTDGGAFSRPRDPLARLAMPLSRSLQRRFARDSLEAMRLTIQS
jgi:hypothetical protein